MKLKNQTGLKHFKPTKNLNHNAYYKLSRFLDNSYGKQKFQMEKNVDLPNFKPGEYSVQ